nr:DUF2934 domain-containing protein [Rhizobium sp. Root708]
MQEHVNGPRSAPEREYRVWVDEGRPEGQHEDHWRRVENQHEETERQAEGVTEANQRASDESNGAHSLHRRTPRYQVVARVGDAW